MEMQREASDQPQAEYLKCAKCGRDAECEIWDHPVCYPCAADWQTKSPTYGQIGQRHAPTVYREFTAKWLAEAKRGAA